MIQTTVSPVLGREEVYIVCTRDGSNTLFSKAFGVTYHSVNGAVSESKHTYIQNGLMTQLNRPEINILEFGFGTGLNAFLSMLFAIKYNKKITYFGFDAYPLSLDIILQLDHPGYLACPEMQKVLERMHQEDSFSLDYFHFLRRSHWNYLMASGPFNCIFFDAFDPVVQTELWTGQIFDQLFEVTSPGGCLVTYSSKGDVRRSMIHAGFDVHRIPAAAGKREMLQAFRSS